MTRRTLCLTLGLLLTGCPNPTPAVVDTPPPACEDPTAALLGADIPAASAIYEACLVGSPDDAELALGAAIMGLLLLHDDPSATGLPTASGTTRSRRTTCRSCRVT